MKSFSNIQNSDPGVKLSLLPILVAIIMIFGLSGNTHAVENNFPFSIGEKLTFQVNWTFVPAGEFVLEVLPMETVNGIRSHHFVLIARTYPFIDLFYKIRDRIDAYTDAEMTRSILYKKRQGGRSKRNIIVDFDHKKQEAQYSNFGKKRRPVSIRHGSFDPLSVFYAFRLQDLRESTEIQKPVTDGKKCVMGKARVLKREKIRVASGSYKTYLVEPELRDIGGVFKKSKNAMLKIWVTADRRCIPVKIKSKVKVGSFVAELVSVENGITEIPSRLRR